MKIIKQNNISPVRAEIKENINRKLNLYLADIITFTQL